MLPQGGQDDYRALFHEAGHTEHFAHTPRRRCRPRSGSWATTPSPRASRSCSSTCLADPALAAARLDLGPRRRATCASRPSYKLFFVRRYAAKLAYELELHSGGARSTSLPARYAELLSAAVGRPLSRAPTTWRTSTAASTAPATCGPGRSRPSSSTTCASRFGRDWFADAARPALLLRELWDLGQSLRRRPLLREVTGSGSEFAVLAGRGRGRARVEEPASVHRSSCPLAVERAPAMPVQAHHPAHVVAAGSVCRRRMCHR